MLVKYYRYMTFTRSSVNHGREPARTSRLYLDSPQDECNNSEPFTRRDLNLNSQVKPLSAYSGSG